MPMPAVSLRADTGPDADARRQANRTAILSFFEFMHTKNIPAWLDLWAENGRILVPYPPQGTSLPSVIDGRAQIGPNFEELFEHFDTWDADIRTIYPTVDADTIIVEWTVDSRLTTGEQYSGDNITVFRFVDGKIDAYHDYFNPESFRTVLQAIA